MKNNFNIYDVLYKFLRYGVDNQGISYDEKSYIKHQFRFSWKYIGTYPDICINSCFEYKLLDDSQISLSFISLNGQIISCTLKYIDANKVNNYETSYNYIPNTWRLDDIINANKNYSSFGIYSAIQLKIDIFIGNLKFVYLAFEDNNMEDPDMIDDVKYNIPDNFTSRRAEIFQAYLKSLGVKMTTAIDKKDNYKKEEPKDFSDSIMKNAIDLCSHKYRMKDGRLFTPIKITDMSINTKDNSKNINTIIDITMEGIAWPFPMLSDSKCENTNFNISIPIKTENLNVNHTIINENDYNKIAHEVINKNDNDFDGEDVDKTSFYNLVNHLWDANEFLQVINLILKGKITLSSFDCSVSSDKRIYILANKKNGEWINFYKLNTLGKTFMTNIKNVKNVAKFINDFYKDYKKGE